jgi:ribosomal-protein-serine acetyltransferase
VTAAEQSRAPAVFPLGDHQELRRLQDEDAEELYRAVDVNRRYLSEWLPWPPTQTPQGTLEFIRLAHRQAADNQGFQMAIVDHEEIVGVIGFHRVDWENRSAGIGYWIAEQAQRRGLVTRAVRALLSHAFDEWRLNRVEIRAGVGNARSRAIPERLGFVHEGVLREAERLGDRYVDHAVYALLAAEWAERRRHYLADDA